MARRKQPATGAVDRWRAQERERLRVAADLAPNTPDGERWRAEAEQLATRADLPRGWDSDTWGEDARRQVQALYRWHDPR